jgi:Associated with zinc fingers
MKTRANKDTAVYLESSEEYRKAVKACREKKITFHCYQLKEEKPFRVVIRNIHPSTPIEMIQQDIESQGMKVRNISCVRKKQTGDFLPLHFVDLERGPDNKKIFEVSRIAYFKVKVEEPHSSEDIPQCHRCQAYGHTKAYCNRSPKCVKCAGNHLTAECNKSREQPAKCVNCGDEHPASYRGCEIHRKLQKKTNKPEPKPTRQSFPLVKPTDLGRLKRQASQPTNSAFTLLRPSNYGQPEHSSEE